MDLEVKVAGTKCRNKLELYKKALPKSFYVACSLPAHIIEYRLVNNPAPKGPQGRP